MRGIGLQRITPSICPPFSFALRSIRSKGDQELHLVFQSNVGASPVLFGMQRVLARNVLGVTFSTASVEPENDFYECEGLILGYDRKNELEYIEVIPPSSAEYCGIHLFSTNLQDLISSMSKMGLTAIFDDGSYNYSAIGMVLYCPSGRLESVSLYKKGYYDE